jgi:hypothetical protein
MHKLYISESQSDAYGGQTCYSAIWQGMPICAHRPDFDAAFTCAKRQADASGEPVYRWYGQAGQFSKEPLYVPVKR